MEHLLDNFIDALGRKLLQGIYYIMISLRHILVSVIMVLRD